MTTYQHLSEIEVINKITDGDIGLFEVLIRRYNPYMYKIGRSYGYSHQDVEDLMQDTFINAFENIGKLKNKIYFKTWLVRIMLNECYRKSHKASSRNEVVSDTFLLEKSTPMFSNDNSSDTEKNVGNRELNRVIENAIESIPMDYRLVFTLRELNGMSVLESAKALNITETNVKVRLNRAKAMLRKEVEKVYSTEDVFQFNLIYCDKIVDGVMKKINPTTNPQQKQLS